MCLFASMDNSPPETGDIKRIILLPITLSMLFQWNLTPFHEVSRNWWTFYTPANIRLDEDVLKTSFVFVFRRRLEDVFKTSWSRPIYLSWPYVFKTFLRRLQDVFKTSSRHLQNVFKISSRRLQDVFKTFWRCLQDVFKTFSRRTIKLICST